ncbi:hypothetical protein [Streptomyces sp. NRRL B-1347]|uniref:hypothetical protein n=1 Tax=Streptomyces sp. NRRL B-1347 TaxID=1476877 RepID=UPI00131E29A4|nr:hypothetical protein [Streptomyces sp. NRRL B-1347]
MERASRLSIHYDTGMFSPLQLQPRAAASLLFMGWTRWLADHATPFPSILRDYRVSFPVVGFRLRYLSPFGFFDGNHFDLTTYTRLLRDRTMLETTAEIRSDDTSVALVSFLSRCLLLDGSESLTGVPGTFPDSFSALFTKEEQPEAWSPGHFSKSLKSLTRDRTPVLESIFHLTVNRHLCEVADQWCFVDIPGHLCAARETMIEKCGTEYPIVRDGLRRPLRSVEFRLTRPLFLLDSATITTSSYIDGDELSFVHHISGPDGAARAAAIETLEYR